MLIPINKKTIRSNPQAGQTCFQIPGRQEISETIIQDGIKFIYRIYKDKKFLVSQESCSEPNSISKNVDQEICTYWTLTPQPKYLYEYENINLNCKECNWTGRIEDLLSEENECRYSYSDRVCPKCRMWNCCEYKYEKLTNEELEKFINHD